MEVNQDSINEMYSRMEENGWNTNFSLKWGFFFVGEAPEKLHQIYAELAPHSYRVENLHQSADRS